MIIFIGKFIELIGISDLLCCAHTSSSFVVLFSPSATPRSPRALDRGRAFARKGAGRCGPSKLLVAICSNILAAVSSGEDLLKILHHLCLIGCKLRKSFALC